MAEIKSALELALEKTEGVKSDKEGVKRKGLNEKGKKMASQFLNDHKDGKKLKKALGTVPKEDKKEVLKGVYQVLKANLTLPREDDFSEDLEVLKTGFTVITDNGNQLNVLFEQLEQFFTQFTQSKEQLYEGLKGQLTPLAQQKSQQISQQRGVQIDLHPEDLPEFGQALQENMAKLTDQFQQALNNVRAELDSILIPA
ncbi:MAG: hypothetical protein JEY99_06500 [Spirochaetales bacterium]|nr:hypothetical protein [Spirochaetales bacterium]